MSCDAARKRLKGWGLSIAPETINITARTLQPETLLFGNNERVNGKPNADWNMEVTKQHVMQSVDVLRWAILFVDRDKQVTDVSTQPFFLYLFRNFYTTYISVPS